MLQWFVTAVSILTLSNVVSFVAGVVFATPIVVWLYKRVRG